MVWHLWSRNRQDEPQGVFSHATALTLHDLSDVMPGKLDMTVPPGFRRMAAIPDVLRLRHARLSERDVETIAGVGVTTPLRTLVDVIAEGAIAQELQVQAVDQALRRGSIMRRQLETSRVSTRARQRIDRILKQVSDGCACSGSSRAGECGRR
jgi:predicted transcriptional regulator of viral defense system